MVLVGGVPFDLLPYDRPILLTFLSFRHFCPFEPFGLLAPGCDLSLLSPLSPLLDCPFHPLAVLSLGCFVPRPLCPSAILSLGRFVHRPFVPCPWRLLSGSGGTCMKVSNRNVVVSKPNILNRFISNQNVSFRIEAYRTEVRIGGHPHIFPPFTHYVCTFHYT